MINFLIDLAITVFTPLLGNKLGEKYQGRKLQLGRIFRLLGVGFSVVGLIIFILIIADKEVDPSGAILCAGPFILIGVAFLVYDIVRKNNLWK